MKNEIDNEIKLEKFNLEKALKGYPVQLGNGIRMVRIIYAPEAKRHSRIITIDENGQVYCFEEDGTYTLNHGATEKNFLYMAPVSPSIQFAIVVNHKTHGRYMYKDLFDTKEDAVSRMNMMEYTNDHQVVEIKIEGVTAYAPYC